MNVLAMMGGASGAVTAGHAIVGVTTCLTLLGFELPQRVAGLRSGSVSLKKYASGAATIAWRCAPEMIGVSACLVVGLALRLRGDVDDALLRQQDPELWDQITKVEWPILCGPDTLLCFQTWLRIIALMFVAARCKIGESMPLAGMPAALFLSAMVARTTLAARTDQYRLEGPLALSGDLPIACEVAMLPRLAWLAVTAFRENPVTATTWIGVTAWFASFHYLNLAANPDADKLFILAHALEFVASMAFLCNTIITHCGSQASKVGASTGFMHLVMPAQAALGAYFFLHFDAFETNVGSGRPYCLLVWSNLLQLGAYLVSAAFFIASQFGLDDPAPENDRQVPVVAGEAAPVNLPSPVVHPVAAEEKSSAALAAREALGL